MPRTAGLRGRLPVKPEGERFALGYVHEYLGQSLPAPQYPVDVSGGITAWGMDGNDRYGDCGFAGREHYKMAKAAAGNENETFESADALVAEYLAYDHGQDVGVNLADVLLYWFQTGKILAFAPVDHTDPAAVDAAVPAFPRRLLRREPDHATRTSCSSKASRGPPRTVQQPDPREGHCIVKVKAGGGGGLDTWVTWGALPELDRGVDLGMPRGGVGDHHAGGCGRRQPGHHPVAG